MEKTLATKALSALKTLHEKILATPDNAEAIEAWQELSKITEAYIVASFLADDDYKDIMHAVISDWVQNRTDAPEDLVMEIKRMVKPGSFRL